MLSSETINDNIVQTSLQLTEQIPLHVYLVKGADYAVFIDSGVKPMFPKLLNTVRESGLGAGDIKYILHTHSHHDHIGSNAQLKAATGCQVAAHRLYAHWHSDFERHYQEFARPFPELVEDTPALRNEVLGVLDLPHTVEVMVDEGTSFDLGGGVELEAYRFAGHMQAELGWYEKSTKTLILGDVITLMNAPFIHGHLIVAGYRESLRKIHLLVDRLGVKLILMAHFPPHSPREIKLLINQAYEYLDQIDHVVIQCLKVNGSADLKTLWKSVCDTLEKVQEFRSLSTVNAHVEDLKQKNVIIESTDGILSLKE